MRTKQLEDIMRRLAGLHGGDNVGERVEFSKEQVDFMFTQAMGITSLSDVECPDATNIFSLDRIKIIFPTGSIKFSRESGSKTLYINVVKNNEYFYGTVDTSNGAFGYFFNKDNKQWRKLQYKVIKLIEDRNKQQLDKAKEDLDRTIYDMFPDQLEKDLMDE